MGLVLFMLSLFCLNKMDDTYIVYQDWYKCSIFLNKMDTEEDDIA